MIDRMDRKKLYIHLDAIPGSVMIGVEPHQVLLEKDSVYSLVTRRKIVRDLINKNLASY